MMSSKNGNNKGTIEIEINSGEISLPGETCQIFGISEESGLSFDNFMAYVHNDDREITKRAIMLAAQFSITNIFNFRFMRPDTGKELFIHSTWHAENDSSGKPVKISGTLLDMTKRGITA